MRAKTRRCAGSDDADGRRLDPTSERHGAIRRGAKVQIRGATGRTIGRDVQAFHISREQLVGREREVRLRRPNAAGRDRQEELAVGRREHREIHHGVGVASQVRDGERRRPATVPRSDLTAPVRQSELVVSPSDESSSGVP
jgi:hypothetical protein